MERRFSKPSGCLTARSAKSFRHPDLVPKGKRRGSAPYIGMPSATARSRSSGVVLYGTRWDRRGFGTSDRIRDSRRGRSRSFSLSGLGDASPTEMRDSRARAWLGITPVSNAR
jgi:hypothetical protein